MDKPLRTALQEVVKKYHELQSTLQSSTVFNDIKKYNRLNKEAQQYAAIVDKFNSFLAAEQKLAQAKEVYNNETDPDFIALAKAEIEDLEEKIASDQHDLKLLLIPRDPNDDKDVIVEMRGAAGGDEANIFVGDLFDIYKRWCIMHNAKVNVIDATRGEAGGYTNLIFRISGDKIYSKLKFETGVHRVQRVPATETQGRIHTSTITVTVMPEADETVDIDINPSEIKIDTFRSSGAGGQSVNTTDSAVRITHLPTGIVISSQDGRSQIANREAAMNLLKTKLFNLQIEKQNETSASYRALAGSGARAEKIRTYNYPQDRVTDHRIAFSMSLKTVESGRIDALIDALLGADQAARINEVGN